MRTPEKLGNYTYGYIGKALGVPFKVLIGGSWYADGFTFTKNEFNDWKEIKKGYDAYRR
ncbi:MAG: polymorphic toxin type 44 domain-containing protein [Oscillospiraceae bacterium]|nr:polymorphic toxin type 44 domain-containing protein [Oscillospiraceae bacterium]